MIKEALYNVAAFSRVPRFYQRFFKRDAVSILMYHAVVRSPLAVPDWCFLDEASFLRHIEYLRSFCHVVRLQDIPHLEVPAKRPLVALTMDDGFLNNFDVAFPILKSFGLPATIFLTTDLIDSEDTVWFCRINEALTRTTLSQFEWEGVVYDLRTTEGRAKAGADLQTRMKKYGHQELMERVRGVVRALGQVPDTPVSRDSPYRMLETKHIRQMQESGLVDFGAHTATHAILSLLPDPDRRREIEESINAVERITGQPCRLFAYPNGRRIDYSPADVKVLQENNVDLAVTTQEGPNTRSVPDWELRRYGIGSDTSMALFQMFTHHLFWTFNH